MLSAGEDQSDFEKRFNHVEYLVGACYHRIEQIRRTVTVLVVMFVIAVCLVFITMVVIGSQQSQPAVAVTQLPVQSKQVKRKVPAVHRSTVVPPVSDSQ